MIPNVSTKELARASSRHPWLVIGVWALVLALSLGVNATLLADVLSGSSEKTKINFTNNPESARAERILEDRLRGPRKVTEVVIVTARPCSAQAVAQAYSFADQLPAILGCRRPDTNRPDFNLKTTGLLLSSGAFSTALPLDAVRRSEVSFERGCHLS